MATSSAKTPVMQLAALKHPIICVTPSARTFIRLRSRSFRSKKPSRVSDTRTICDEYFDVSEQHFHPRLRHSLRARSRAERPRDAWPSFWCFLETGEEVENMFLLDRYCLSCWTSGQCYDYSQDLILLCSGAEGHRRLQIKYGRLKITETLMDQTSRHTLFLETTRRPCTVPFTVSSLVVQQHFTPRI